MKFAIEPPPTGDTKRIFVDRHALERNTLEFANAKRLEDVGDMVPTVRINSAGCAVLAHEADIVKDGEVVARVRYSSTSKESGVSHVWLETDCEVREIFW